jgi:hypothetical protein
VLSRHRARYVIPDYPDQRWRLPESRDERAFLEGALGATAVVSHHEEVLELLRGGDFDLLHIAGHGYAPPGELGDAQILLQGRMDGDGYQPEALLASVVRQNFDRRDGRRPGPIVVLNACQAGRLGTRLSTVGGFAEAFVGGGAAAFVGCLWSVGDGLARMFVEAFYEKLMAGATVCEATVGAREVARARGDSTWLVYTVYAHPSARLTMQ